MTFEDIVDQALAMLQRRGRVAYRTLKRQFQLDDEALEDLKIELIKAQRLAADEGGEVLMWTGAGAPAPVREAEPPAAPRQELPTPAGPRTASPSPIAYTPSHLAERIRAEQVALEARGTPDGERKTITALFADIKGSMDLLEDLDPEEARRIVDPALTLMMQAVHGYEGYVAQSLGDGIFALFGAPRHWFRFLQLSLRSMCRPLCEASSAHGARSHGPASLKPLPGLDVWSKAPGQHAAHSRTHLALRGVVLGSWHTYGCAGERRHNGVAARDGRRPEDWPASLGWPETGRCLEALETVLDTGAVWDRVSALGTLCACAAL
jgi:hypothetical protein